MLQNAVLKSSHIFEDKAFTASSVSCIFTHKAFTVSFTSMYLHAQSFYAEYYVYISSRTKLLLWVLCLCIFTHKTFTLSIMSMYFHAQSFHCKYYVYVSSCTKLSLWVLNLCFFMHKVFTISICLCVSVHKLSQWGYVYVSSYAKLYWEFSFHVFSGTKLSQWLLCPRYYSHAQNVAEWIIGPCIS